MSNFKQWRTQGAGERSPRAAILEGRHFTYKYKQNTFGSLNKFRLAKVPPIPTYLMLQDEQ